MVYDHFNGLSNANPFLWLSQWLEKWSWTAPKRKFSPNKLSAQSCGSAVLARCSHLGGHVASGLRLLRDCSNRPMQSAPVGVMKLMSITKETILLFLHSHWKKQIIQSHSSKYNWNLQWILERNIKISTSDSNPIIEIHTLRFNLLVEFNVPQAFPKEFRRVCKVSHSLPCPKCQLHRYPVRYVPLRSNQGHQANITECGYELGFSDIASRWDLGIPWNYSSCPADSNPFLWRK